MKKKTANIKEYRKNYYQNHKEKMNNYSKNYYKKRKELDKNYMKDYIIRYRRKIKSDTNVYLVLDPLGNVIFTFSRKQLISKLGMKNKQIDSALASGNEINGFYLDVEII